MLSITLPLPIDEYPSILVEPGDRILRADDMGDCAAFVLCEDLTDPPEVMFNAIKEMAQTGKLNFINAAAHSVLVIKRQGPPSANMVMRLTQHIRHHPADPLYLAVSEGIEFYVVQF